MCVVINEVNTEQFYVNYGQAIIFNRDELIRKSVICFERSMINNYLLK